MNNPQPLAPYVQRFFHAHLGSQKGVSQHTALAYRDCLKLFLSFASARFSKPADRLLLEEMEEDLVIDFLDDLEANRRNATRTRNARLAALRTFFHYVGGCEPTSLARCHQICSLPDKRGVRTTIEYLNRPELKALLEAVDPRTPQGVRDYALLLFLYNTGARVQEAASLEMEDLRLYAPYQVRIHGKGGKERLCPLWPETVSAVREYLECRRPEAPNVALVFLNGRGRGITRFGIRHIVRKHAANASNACPSLCAKKVSPHALRHTTAMHLLQSGCEINVIKHWLGHANLNTTHGYIEIDMDMKRKALETMEPATGTSAEAPDSPWLEPGILHWLENLSKRASNM